MQVRDFDFPLPPELIAQEPPEQRDGARMLTLDRRSGELADRLFTDLPTLLHPGDLFILNNSRVLPSRLYAERANPRTQPGQAPTSIEVLLVEPVTNDPAPHTWRALLRPARKAPVGERLLFRAEGGAALLHAEVVAEGEYGERTLRFELADASSACAPEAFYALLDQLGHMPLPPYIHRADSREDRDRYQTIYAQERGSVAAPTAGLHFTPEVLASVEARGVELQYVTLHVGLGTFQPVRVEQVAEIRLHAERYTLPPETAEAIARARRDNRRILAAGTTTVRTLEHCAQTGQLQPHTGSTEIFLSPGAEFRLVDGMLTNFHLPQSTLLMLVAAFAGYQHTMAAYAHAVREHYRFFSYGDCMFIS